MSLGNIYSLNESNFLYKDVEDIIKIISDLYNYSFKEGRIVFMPKTSVSNKYSMFSKEVTDEFNKLVPRLKSLVRDIYALIENIFVAKYGEFKKLKLEEKYEFLKELRLLNNKLKHYANKGVEITLTQCTLSEGQDYTIDCFFSLNIRIMLI